jgi:DNA-binding protein HU-beta
MLSRYEHLEASSMKLTDLVDHVANEAGIEKGAARKAVDAVFAGIVDAAKKGEEVNLAGFGKFKVKDSQARQGRNPSTGAVIEIAASQARLQPGETGEGGPRGLTFAGVGRSIGALTAGHAPTRQETGTEADGAPHETNINQKSGRNQKGGRAGS